RGDAAIAAADLVGSHRNAIVDSGLYNKSANLIGIVFIGGKRDDFELVRVAVLQIDKIGNLRAARSAPRRPKIKQDNFALGPGKRERSSFKVIQLERR